MSQFNRSRRRNANWTVVGLFIAILMIIVPGFVYRNASSVIMFLPLVIGSVMIGYLWDSWPREIEIRENIIPKAEKELEISSIVIQEYVDMVHARVKTIVGIMILFVLLVQIMWLTTIQKILLIVNLFPEIMLYVIGFAILGAFYVAMHEVDMHVTKRYLNKHNTDVQLIYKYEWEWRNVYWP